MESSGAPMQIQTTGVFAQLLSSTGAFVVQPRGEIQVKGKGQMQTFWLTGYSGNPLPPAKLDPMSRASPLLEGFPTDVTAAPIIVALSLKTNTLVKASCDSRGYVLLFAFAGWSKVCGCACERLRGFFKYIPCVWVWEWSAYLRGPGCAHGIVGNVADARALLRFAFISAAVWGLFG
eukprot:RCo026618